MKIKRRLLCRLAAWTAAWMLLCSGCGGSAAADLKEEESLTGGSVSVVEPTDQAGTETVPQQQMESQPEPEPAPPEAEEQADTDAAEPPPSQPALDVAEQPALQTAQDNTDAAQGQAGSIPDYLLPNRGKDIAGQTADGAGGEQITVTLSIDCSNADGYNIPCDTIILSDTEMQVSAGATVYQLLQQAAKSHGFAVAKSGGGSNVYIQGIAGLFEKDCGNGSGWMYRVNGEFPMASVSGYQLSDGDMVEFCYTLNMGNDLGA